MELKRTIARLSLHGYTRFNRTFMELKLSYDVYDEDTDKF